MRCPTALFVLALLTAAAQSLAQTPLSSTPDSGLTMRLNAPIWSFDWDTKDFWAKGDVRIDYDLNSLSADEIRGNMATREFFATHARAKLESMYVSGDEITTRRTPVPGKPDRYDLKYYIKNGSATTCDLPNPHYRISAREIVVEGDRATAKHVSFWLGRKRLLTFPRLATHLGTKRGTESFLPKPGYDNRDGLFIGLDNTLVETSRSYVALSLKATQRNGLLGSVRAERLLLGEALLGNPQAQLYLSDRPLLLPAIDESNGVCPAVYQNQVLPRQLIAFVRAAYRERVYDINATGLLVSTAPEAGVRWISDPLRLGGRGAPSVYAVAQTSWGWFDQSGGIGQSRLDGRLTLATLPLPLPGRIALQPAVSVRSSGYRDGESYRTIGRSADLSHAFGRLYAGARYVSYTVRGSTPFVFDDIDRKREAQARMIYRGRRQGASVLVRYDLDRRNVFDWAVAYTRRVHCIEPTFTWHNRFGLFTLDVKVLGLK